MNSVQRGHRKAMTFILAVQNAPEVVARAFLLGKQALRGNHAAQVACMDERRWTGSINIDQALMGEADHAQACRWDYGLGYLDPTGTERAVWVEVHSAETSEVSKIICKLTWLKDYLSQHCTDLWELTQKGDQATRFVWLASGRCNIPSHMPQLRRLRTAGLQPPARRLELP